MVARALPGGGGSAARARASAACLAAWRAAQGAAPRRPSLRFEGGTPFWSSLMTGLPGLASPTSAEDLFGLEEEEGFFFFATEALAAFLVGFVAFDIVAASPLTDAVAPRNSTRGPTPLPFSARWMNGYRGSLP